ncbi:MAG: choice-of-anchor J domain-containing protein [Flavobacteriales bacterium]|nr:MAG: choice-of-anchor J domain-containing protein [Flavobacteriales bacterium]
MRTTTLFVLCLPFAASAQTALPYTTGFDNAAQQQGWQQFRTGHLSNYSWGISANAAASAPNKLWHDYPVGGNATDTVRDWYVSPLLDLSGGAVLTCKANIYAIMGSSMPSDACGIYLLTGNANPDLATATPLQDLLPLITTGSTYTTTTAVNIPPTSGTAHIAFYYQATQNWLTPGIDDVSVQPVNVGVAEHGALANMSISMSPREGLVTIALNDARYNGAMLTLQLWDARGAQVLQQAFRDRAELTLPGTAGHYICTLCDGAGNVVARAPVQRIQ